MTVAAAELKACCASAYSSSAARWLLGDYFHPGGAQLTSQLARALRVESGSIVVDVASGPGTSALHVARETGCDVVGVELAAENVAAAAQAAKKAGLDARVRFVQGDAEALPLADKSMDGAICECALCTFPDKDAAARELARVLRPGARLALSDMTADAGQLPPELTDLQAWVACIADARPLAEIATLLERSGFDVEATERHDEALEALLDRLDMRLRTARLLGAGLFNEGIGRGRRLIGEARRALDQGLLGYGVVVARRA